MVRLLVLGLAGSALGSSAGFLIGAALGLAMTAVNNRLLTGAPQGSYTFWALFMGELFALFSWIPGAAGAVVLSLRRK
jgi:hypothetical protein